MTKQITSSFYFRISKWVDLTQNNVKATVLFGGTGWSWVSIISTCLGSPTEFVEVFQDGTPVIRAFDTHLTYCTKTSDTLLHLHLCSQVMKACLHANMPTEDALWFVPSLSSPTGVGLRMRGLDFKLFVHPLETRRHS